MELTGDAPPSLNRAELDSASEALAIELQARGIGAGNRLIAQLPNVVELAVLYYAASKLGAILSPVPVQYGSHELRMIAATLGASAMISIQRLRDTPLAEQARTALPGLPVLAFGSDLQLLTGPCAQRCERGPGTPTRYSASAGPRHHRHSQTACPAPTICGWLPGATR